MSFLASQNHQVGDLIYKGEPFVRVIRHDLWDKICANCLRSDCPLKICGACGIMKYCEKLCQKKAWKDHKWECPYLRNYTDLRQQETVQMIGNIILKINGRDWKTVTERIMDAEVSFDELVSNAGSTTELDKLTNLLSVAEPLMAYIGKENMPNNKTLYELLGKVMHNRFGFIRDDSVSEVFDGSCLFIGASKFDHSCVPNSTIKVNGLTIAFRAIKPIHKSEKITISYFSMIEKIESSVMHKKMKRSFRRNCYCSDCSQPYGESALTKVIDRQKASSVLKQTKEVLELIVTVKRATSTLEWLYLKMLKQLLQAQEGVLGNTNLYRMRTLAWYCFFNTNGPKKEKRIELKQLVDSMIEVWGEYFPELGCVYMELIKVNLYLRRPKVAFMYAKKVCQLKTVCLGVEYDDENIYAKVLCDTLRRFAI